jgi:hypothetical protein
MKKLSVVFLAVSLILSAAVIGSSMPGDASFSAPAQQVTVKKKRKGGIVRKSYRGGKWVARKSWDGTKWVSKRVWSGSKWVGKKSWKTGRKVVSRTKKIVY